MTRSGIEPRSPGPLANTLFTRANEPVIYIYIYIVLRYTVNKINYFNNLFENLFKILSLSFVEEQNPFCLIQTCKMASPALAFVAITKLLCPIGISNFEAPNNKFSPAKQVLPGSERGEAP